MKRMCLIAAFFLCGLSSDASAQLVAAKDGPIVYGHHHVTTISPDQHRKFWADTLGGTAVKVGKGNLEIIRMTNVLIFMRAQAAKGGTKGTTHDHIALSVPNLRQTIDKVKANGFGVVTAAEAPPGLIAKGDIAEVAGGPISGIAYVLGPDDVKVELMEIKAQTEPVKLHHIHFFGPQKDMHAWYVKVFGATPAAAANPSFVTANLPGVGLNFTQATGVVGTVGRGVDHIGFEVKNLQDFLKKLEAQGITPTVTYRRVDALDIAIAFIVDPWGTNIELTEGLDRIQ